MPPKGGCGYPKGTARPDSVKSKNMWLLRLSRTERSTLIATWTGWTLDGLDVMVYSFVIPSLIAAWHITSAQAGLLGTSALLISAAGGWLAGIAADRYGRVRILQITIAWFALFTFLSGFTNGFLQLLVVRGLQGLGFGGEWAVGSVLMGETIRSEYRGRVVGTVQGGWAVGWALAAGFYSLFFSVFPREVAWRAMFWIGILPALLLFYIQRRVPEPEMFKPSRGSLQIFSPALVRITVLASLVALGAQGGYYAITTWLPLYLKTERNLSVLNTAGYLFVVIAGSFIGYLISATLTDRIGRRRTLLGFAVCSLATVWLYMALPLGNTVMLALGFPLGFFASGVFSPLGSFFTELFPTRLRGSGQGFSYNLGRGIGALFPTLVGILSAHTSLGFAIAIFSASAYLLMILGVCLLPETSGKDLR